MKTRIIYIEDTYALTEEARDLIKQAADVLKRGGLVVFPTETVYGIGANAFDEDAVGRIYEAKGRPPDNPMIVHIASAGDIGLLSEKISPEAARLADVFWPGPLTMVLEKRPEIPARVTGGLSTVGVRFPGNEIAVELIRLAGVPVAAPSANLSGRPSPTRAEHVISDLDGKVDVILAGPDCRVGIESTVIDMTVSPPQVLRPGLVTKDDIETALGGFIGLSEHTGDGSFCVAEQAAAEHTGDGSFCVAGSPDQAAVDAQGPQSPEPQSQGQRSQGPRSPGMKYRHYAPKAKMLIISGQQEKVSAEIARLKALNEELGLRVGVLQFRDNDNVAIARDFYAALREIDAKGVDLILVGALPDTDGVGFAVMNRMLKAADNNVVHV